MKNNVMFVPTFPLIDKKVITFTTNCIQELQSGYSFTDMYVLPFLLIIYSNKSPQHERCKSNWSQYDLENVYKSEVLIKH